MIKTQFFICCILLTSLLSCDNIKEINYPDNNNIKIFDTQKSKQTSEIENNFRIIIVGDYKDRIIPRITYYPNGKRKLLNAPFFYASGIVQKASYFSFPNGYIPNNFILNFWNRSEGKGQIYLENIIFKYKGNTKIIPASQFLDHFTASKYLYFEEETKVLTVKNHSKKIFRAAFCPKNSLLTDLKVFTNNEGFNSEDTTLINSLEYKQVFDQ